MKQDLVPRAVARVVVRRTVRPLLHPRVPLAVRRKGLELGGAGAGLPTGTQVETEVLGDRPAELLSPALFDPARTVLLLHGGAFTTCSPATHRALAAHLAASSHRQVHVLDYRLAPEHPYPAALEDAEAAYLALVDRGTAPTDIALVGDSAGAGLALSLAVRLREACVPLPGALGLLSPWVDLSLSTPSVRDDRRDPLLRFSWLEESAQQYAGQVPRTDPGVSPLLADLSGMPRTMVQVGSDEILRPDAARLAARLEAQGVLVHVRVGRDLWHDWHLLAGTVPEATAAVAELGAFLRR